MLTMIIFKVIVSSNGNAKSDHIKMIMSKNGCV